jgi:gluconate 5-dehydrogenase
MSGILELFKLDGRVAMVTGGASGIGKGIAAALGEAGARVAIADFDGDAAEETARAFAEQGQESMCLTMDVTDRTQVRRGVGELISAWGGIEILVNSAGIAIKGAALDYSEEDWDRIIAVNLKGTFLPMQSVGRHMAERKRGKIINLASIGSFVAYPGSMAYLASKGGVAQLTRSFALELAAQNVQVNAIAPTLCNTPMTKRVRSDTADYFVDRTPMGRMAEPEDVAAAAVYLASDASNMVTGHILAVDGGFLIA